MVTHIALVTQCFPPQIGGIETLLSSIVSALHGGEYRVTVFADGPGSLTHPSGAHLHRFSGPKPWRKWRKQNALKKTDQHHPFSLMIYDSWKSAEYITPLFPAVSSFIFAHGNEWLPTTLKRNQRRKLAVKNCSKILANSAYTKGIVTDCLQSTKSVEVLYPSAHIPKSYMQLEKEAKPIKNLIMVARFEERKGQDYTIKAVANVRKKHPNITLTLVGQGPYETVLRKLVDEYQLQKSTRFIVNANNEEKFSAMQSADAFIMPTRLIPNRSVEGFGISYIEAMFIGLPIIAGNTGGPIDIISHKETGFLCNGNDVSAIEASIHQLISDPDLAYVVAKKAHSFAHQSFTPDVFRSNLIKYLHSAHIE